MAHGDVPALPEGTIPCDCVRGNGTIATGGCCSDGNRALKNVMFAIGVISQEQIFLFSLHFEQLPDPYQFV